jgi:hypothetical protein
MTDRVPDKLTDPLQLRAVAERPDLRIVLTPVANPGLPCSRGESLSELVVEAVRDIDALYRDTYLAAIGEGVAEKAVGDLAHVGVVKHTQAA